MRTVDPAKYAEKRQEILVAAGRCFGRNGFQGATISAICAEAKISPGHLYHYFESKEAIISAMAEGRVAHAEARFREMARSSDALTALIGSVKRVKRRGARAGRAIMLDLLVEAGRNPAIAVILRDHSLALRDQLAAFLRQGQERGQVDSSLDANVAAGVLLSVMDGAMTLGIRDPDRDTDQSIKLMQTMIVRFLTPQAETNPAAPAGA